MLGTKLPMYCYCDMSAACLVSKMCIISVLLQLTEDYIQIFTVVGK